MLCIHAYTSQEKCRLDYCLPLLLKKGACKSPTTSFLRKRLTKAGYIAFVSEVHRLSTCTCTYMLSSYRPLKIQCRRLRAVEIYYAHLYTIIPCTPLFFKNIDSSTWDNGCAVHTPVPTKPNTLAQRAVVQVSMCMVGTSNLYTHNIVALAWEKQVMCY